MHNLHTLVNETTARVSSGVTHNLQEEEPLGGLLNELVGDVFRVKLASELDQQRVFPLHVLCRHLGGRHPQQEIGTN